MKNLPMVIPPRRPQPLPWWRKALLVLCGLFILVTAWRLLEDVLAPQPIPEPAVVVAQDAPAEVRDPLGSTRDMVEAVDQKIQDWSETMAWFAEVMLVWLVGLTLFLLLFMHDLFEQFFPYLVKTMASLALAAISPSILAAMGLG